MEHQLRLARVATVPSTLKVLLADQSARILDVGIDLTLIASDEEELAQLAQNLGARYQSIEMARQPAIIPDLKSLLDLYRYFRRQRFDIVHSSTPKAGLLTALAGRAAAVPIRLHTFTGQRWVTLSGLSRLLLKTFDRLIGMLNSQLYADSISQKNFLIEEGIIKSEKICVLGSGSISGVNIDRFSEEKWGGEQRERTRSQLGISSDSIVISFVGRVTKDKGIVELIEAFIHLIKTHHDVFLVIVGPAEPHLDPIPERITEIIDTNKHILATGFTSAPEKYLGAADIFCLPSYREGFGTVVMEAGAMGLPSVATSITGLVDAIIDGQTGILVPPKNVEALADALMLLIEQPELRQKLGEAAKTRAMENFRDSFVNNLVVEEYYRLANMTLTPRSRAKDVSQVS